MPLSLSYRYPRRLPLKKIRKRTVNLTVNLKVPTSEVGLALLSAAQTLFPSLFVCTAKIVLLSKENEVVHNAVAEPVVVPTAPEEPLADPAVCTRKLASQVYQLAGETKFLKDAAQTLSAQLQTVVEDILPAVLQRLPASTAGVSVLHSEPRSFAELPAFDEASLPDLIAADKKKNQEMACSFYILHPPDCTATSSDQQFAQGILDQLKVTAEVVATNRTFFGQQPTIEVFLNATKSSEVCAKFRQHRALLDFSSTLVLKMKRTMFLRNAMYRMYRSLESPLFQEAVVEQGWFVRLGDQDRFTPYSFLHPTLLLQSGSSLPVVTG